MSVYALGEPFGYGKGFQQLVRGTTPAAGTSFSLNMDSRYTSRLIACVFTFTSDANAANRYLTLEVLQDDTTPFQIGGAGLVITANTTNQRFCGSMYRGVAEWATNTDVMFPILPMFLVGGDTLKINVANVQATDALTVIRFLFDRFPTGGDMLPTLPNT